MDPRPDGRLHSLDGLRFIAAFAVLFFHHGAPLLAGAPAWAERLRLGGYAWVSLFYVLSGFVLARANPAPLSPAGRRAFWFARLARLYPAYLLAFVLSAPFALERWKPDGPHAVARAAAVAGATLLLAQAWVPPIARLWNAPGWSTSVVLAFSLLFPFAVARLSRLGRRGLWLALAGAWVLSLSAPALYLAVRPDGPVTNLFWDEPPWLLALKFHPLTRVGEFLAGVSLGLLDTRGLLLPGAAIAGPLALAAIVAFLAWGGAPFVLVHNGLLAPLYAVAILSLAHGGPLARLLGCRPARALGDASYALYLLQEPLWLFGRRLTGAGEQASAGFVFTWSLASVAVSLAAARLVERPARRALRALRAPAATSARGAGPHPAAARGSAPPPP